MGRDQFPVPPMSNYFLEAKLRPPANPKCKIPSTNLCNENCHDIVQLSLMRMRFKDYAKTTHLTDLQGSTVIKIHGTIYQERPHKFGRH
jgi:hypothetical protein